MIANLEDRERHVLMAISPAGTRTLSPVQVQKLFFLLDKGVAGYTGGPHFAFVPYDYGPFDKEVYRVLQSLSNNGFAEILGSNWHSSRLYRLTTEGNEIGGGELKKLPKDAQRHIRDLVEWIIPLSFSELVSAIYGAYPGMKVNSVFQDNS